MTSCDRSSKSFFSSPWEPFQAEKNQNPAAGVAAADESNEILQTNLYADRKGNSTCHMFCVWPGILGK